MIADIFGMDGIVVVIIAVVVLFGSSQLPRLAKNIGSAGQEFRRAHQEANGEVAPVEEESTASRTLTSLASQSGSDNDRLVIGRSELRHELAVARALGDLDGQRATTIRRVGGDDDQPTGEDTK
jgi:TatA/E family protein of Tat protein translocase